MPTWEVRKVTGKGYVNDLPIKAFKDLDKFEIQDMKMAYGVIHVGSLADFVDFDSLIANGKTKNNFTEADLDLIHASWQGKPLPKGHVYCVTMEDAPQGQSVAESLRKAFEMKIEDRVVMADKDNKFAGSVTNEARKNVTQPSVGGVWGVKRKTPPRT